MENLIHEFLKGKPLEAATFEALEEHLGIGVTATTKMNRGKCKTA